VITGTIRTDSESLQTVAHLRSVPVRQALASGLGSSDLRRQSRSGPRRLTSWQDLSLPDADPTESPNDSRASTCPPALWEPFGSSRRSPHTGLSEVRADPANNTRTCNKLRRFTG
jgi:hypothetical protein